MFSKSIMCCKRIVARVMYCLSICTKYEIVYPSNPPVNTVNVSLWSYAQNAKTLMHYISQALNRCLQKLFVISISTISLFSFCYFSANLSSYSHYVFSTLDHEDTGVITFEVSYINQLVMQFRSTSTNI